MYLDHRFYETYIMLELKVFPTTFHMLNFKWLVDNPEMRC